MAVWLAGGIPYSVVDVLNAPPELFDIIGADFELAQLRYTFVNVTDIERESVQNAFHRRLQAMGVSEGRRTMICPWYVDLMFVLSAGLPRRYRIRPQVVQETFFCDLP
jgi:hypothetical protein